MNFTNNPGNLRPICELSDDELCNLFDRSEALQRLALDSMMELAGDHVSEYLACWDRRAVDYRIGWDRRAVDYRIGWDRGAYFTCEDKALFLEGLHEAQRRFGLLPDSKAGDIQRAADNLEHLREMYWDETVTGEEYDRAEEELDELCADLADDCFRVFMGEYEDCFDDVELRDYALNYFVPYCLCDDTYVTDTGELVQYVGYKVIG